MIICQIGGVVVFGGGVGVDVGGVVVVCVCVTDRVFLTFLDV